MSEVGIIGQAYEDRRTKRVGTLLERDEKYKTLLFKSPDGKTFNTSYGTFKSNYRKCELSQAETNEEVAVEKVAEVKSTSMEVTKKPAKKSQKNFSDSKDALKFYNAFVDDVIAFVNTFDINRVTMANNVNKCVISVKVDYRRLFETYSKHRKKLYNTIIPIETVSEYPELKDLGEMHQFLETSANKNNVCLHLLPENRKKFFQIMYNIALDKLSNKVEEE